MRFETGNVLMINRYKMSDEPIFEKINKGKSEFDGIAFILFLNLSSSFLIFDI